jgi:arylformamidase
MKRFIDLTCFIKKDMPVWPGDQGPIIAEAMTIEKDMVSLQSIHFTTHLGTHIDAPSHIIKGGMTVDQIPLETLIGKASVLDFSHKREKEPISKEDLREHKASLLPGSRILLRTGWDSRFGSESFFTAFPCLTLEAAQYLSMKKIALLGMDTPSPSPVDDPGQGIHKTLLGAGIVLLEGLCNLKQMQGDECQLIALPAPFKDFSGAPCRAIAIDHGHPRFTIKHHLLRYARPSSLRRT